MEMHFLTASLARTADWVNRMLQQAVRLPTSVCRQSEDIVGLDENAPVICAGRSGLQIAGMRWGFPPKSLTHSNGWNPPIGLIDDVDQRWWRELNEPYLNEPRFRCLVPLTALCLSDRRKHRWMRPLEGFGFLAAIWRPWEGDTRLIALPGQPGQQRVQARLHLFTCLRATGPRPVAPPVILRQPDHLEEWLGGQDAALFRDLTPPKVLVPIEPPGGEKDPFRGRTLQNAFRELAAL
jgi:putative SOS response-associated peptidase YedK